MKIHTFSAAILATFSCNTLANDGPYWTTVNGNIFRSATTGECVRSGSWTPEDAIEECEGKGKATIPPAAAPVAAAAPAAADSDGDGVADDMDKCPGSPADKPVDAEGCTIVSVVLKNVQFESNSSELTAGSSEALDKAVAEMDKYEHLRIEIQAHTDNTGDAGYNQSLSRKRAESVRDYMVHKGIAADRMEVKGYGESKPIADNNTREGRAANRRVELKIID
jgi:OOP family OmpA-OmpF porin